MLACVRVCRYVFVQYIYKYIELSHVVNTNHNTTLFCGLTDASLCICASRARVYTTRSATVADYGVYS